MMRLGPAPSPVCFCIGRDQSAYTSSRHAQRSCILRRRGQKCSKYSSSFMDIPPMLAEAFVKPAAKPCGFSCAAAGQKFPQIYGDDIRGGARPSIMRPLGESRPKCGAKRRRVPPLCRRPFPFPRNTRIISRRNAQVKRANIVILYKLLRRKKTRPAGNSQFLGRNEETFVHSERGCARWCNNRSACHPIR